jgi:AraC-like DNA-binding protein
MTGDRGNLSGSRSGNECDGSNQASNVFDRARSGALCAANAPYCEDALEKTGHLRSSPRRQVLAQRAEELLRRRLPEPVTIRDLCDMIGVSRRSLHLGFREYFGMSPKQYLKKLRLSGARHDLCHAGPGTLVTDVALHWNFFHLGRFASDYTRCFGENPSRTLNVREEYLRDIGMSRSRPSPAIPDKSNGAVFSMNGLYSFSE